MRVTEQLVSLRVVKKVFGAVNKHSRAILEQLVSFMQQLVVTPD